MAIFNSYVSLPEGSVHLEGGLLQNPGKTPPNPRHPQRLKISKAFALSPGFSDGRGVHRVDMAVCQNLVPLVNIKIAGKWMFIPLKMVLIGIDPYPYGLSSASLEKTTHLFTHVPDETNEMNKNY